VEGNVGNSTFAQIFAQTSVFGNQLKSHEARCELADAASGGSR
jgi:hypothetical protein